MIDSFFHAGICYKRLVWGWPLLLVLVSCGARQPVFEPAAYLEVGVASYYARKFHGRPTASGERYDENAMTAAHPHLPFGTLLEVKSLENHRTVVVRVNDRGPFIKGRIVDVSRAAAKRLGMLQDGLIRVEVTLAESPDGTI